MSSTLINLLREGTLEQVKAHIEENPESVKERDEETGRIALHDAMIPRLDDNDEIVAVVDIEKINVLLGAYPKGITIQDNQGRLPLHVAEGSTHAAPLSSLWLLMKAYGAATLIRDSKGYLPVHCAITAHNFRTATFLLEENLGSFDDTIVEGVAPILHMALEYDAPDHFIALLLEKIPNCCKAVGNDGRLSMHSALFHWASRHQVELILDAHPAALQQPDDDLSLPIHYEAANGARLEVLTLLLARFPESAEKANIHGALAIHAAVQSCSVTVESLQLLSQSHSTGTGLFAVDKHGNTVLHYAFPLEKDEDPNGVSEPIVAWLLENCPSLVQTANKYGDFPLHYAAGNSSCPLHIMHTLIERFPKALKVQGEGSNLPLHEAVGGTGAERVRKENIQLLLDKYPAASRITNGAGQLPLHVACARNDATREIVDMLLDANPDGLSIYDKNGYFPFHVACVEGKNVSSVNHFITNLDGALLPSTKDGTSALFLACEKDTSLDIILTLVQHSQEAFPGDMYTDHGDKKRPSLSCSSSLRSRCKCRKA